MSYLALCSHCCHNTNQCLYSGTPHCSLFGTKFQRLGIMSYLALCSHCCRNTNQSLHSGTPHCTLFGTNSNMTELKRDRWNGYNLDEHAIIMPKWRWRNENFNRVHVLLAYGYFVHPLPIAYSFIEKTTKKETTKRVLASEVSSFQRLGIASYLALCSHSCHNTNQSLYSGTPHCTLFVTKNVLISEVGNSVLHSLVFTLLP